MKKSDTQEMKENGNGKLKRESKVKKENRQ
jgi:hypothetical protein